MLWAAAVQTRPPADARILKLRAYEDNLAAYRDTVQVRPAQRWEGYACCLCPEAPYANAHGVRRPPGAPKCHLTPASKAHACTMTADAAAAAVSYAHAPKTARNVTTNILGTGGAQAGRGGRLGDQVAPAAGLQGAAGAQRGAGGGRGRGRRGARGACG